MSKWQPWSSFQLSRPPFFLFDIVVTSYPAGPLDFSGSAIRRRNSAHGTPVTIEPANYFWENLFFHVGVWEEISIALVVVLRVTDLHGPLSHAIPYR